MSPLFSTAMYSLLLSQARVIRNTTADLQNYQGVRNTPKTIWFRFLIDLVKQLPKVDFELEKYVGLPSSIDSSVLY